MGIKRASEIAVERAQLVKDKKIKKPKTLSEISKMTNLLNWLMVGSGVI
ncbi:MAG: hypothetical protein ACJAXN_000924 [Psychromonas sp.]